MKASLLLAGILTGVSALPQAIIEGQGFTTNPNDPTAEEPCVEGQPLIPDPFHQLYPCTLGETPAEEEVPASGENILDKTCTNDDECSGPWCAGGGASGTCGEEGKCVCGRSGMNEEKEEEQKQEEEVVTDVPPVDKPCDQDEDCPGEDCNLGYCDMGAGKCVCPKPAPEQNPQPQGPELDTNSEEWKKVDALDDLDRCVLFELIQCNNNPADNNDFDAWGMCSYQSKAQDMEQCMPTFLELSAEDQQKKLNEISEARKKKEGESGERISSSERIRKWKEEGAIWVTEQEGANTVITISDKKVNFGSLDPWEVVASINEKCPPPLQACKAGESYPSETVVYLKDYDMSKEARKAQLVMDVTGSWHSTQELGGRTQLLDAVKKTLDGLKDEGLIERKEKEKMMIGPCQKVVREDRIVCNENNKQYDVYQWTMTDTIQVRVTDDGGGEIGFINVGFKLVMPEATSAIGFCGAGLGAGAGIAAMFAAPGGPAVAAGLLIGAVFCNFGS